MPPSVPRIRFQSTLPRRERRIWWYMHRSYGEFQSTLPRRERPMPSNTRPVRRLFQSTLPRRERLSSAEIPDDLIVISIHAPTKGATLPAYPSNWCHPYFNPRSHEGSDQNNMTMFRCPIYFNPRSHEGSDLSLLSSQIGQLFQSTLPRRERRAG